MKQNKFWSVKDGKVTIIQSKLIEFLNDSGFAKAIKSNTDYVLVRETQNTVNEISDHKIVEYVQEYLKKVKEPDVLEAFICGISNYISKSKLRLLKSVDLLNDRDNSTSSWFYFQNICCKVEKSSITRIPYEDIREKIWASRIIKKDCYLLLNSEKSQFQEFCQNISSKNPERFKALTTIIGYLLHRYQDPGNARAIILVDEKITFDGAANGGTGKSLLLQAIGKCRELVVMDGKQIKEKSWFRNQRINYTTDVIFYDDVKKDFSLEILYSMITTGISVEKKYRAEEFISADKAPKICISSNFVVKGTGGSTELRRRCDFELAPHYSELNKPEDEFGNLFFNDWSDDEWNRFYHFMMECVQQYFKYGLIIAQPINLKRNRLITETSEELVIHSESKDFTLNQWVSKKQDYDEFVKQFPHLSHLSMNQLTRWYKIYAKHNELIYSDRKSGDKYEFYLNSIAEAGKEASDEEE